MKILKQVKVITPLLIIWQKYDSPRTSRSETHVLLSIKNEASHWLAIWTVCSTLTYCKRRGETMISTVIHNNQIIHNSTLSLLSASMFVSQLLILQLILHRFFWYKTLSIFSFGFGFKESMKRCAVLRPYLLCWTGQSWAGLSASLHWWTCGGRDNMVSLKKMAKLLQDLTVCVCLYVCVCLSQANLLSHRQGFVPYKLYN